MTSKLTSSSLWSVYNRLLVTCLLLGFASSTTADAFEYQHGTSYLEPLKYNSGFTHFEWANPDAPKGGLLRAPEMGTFDSFNGILDKGRVANGVARGGEGALIYDRLLEGAIDEPASFYGRLADGVWVAADFRRFAFRIREGAYWHDGKPLGADDVVYTFRLLKEKGAVAVRTGLRELGSIEKISDNEVLFTTKPNATGNPDLIFQVGGYSILPEHYWASRDITKTTVEPPLGSGPYKVRDFDLGRNVTYERVENYWGRDIPVNRGRYNYDRIKYDYFRDESVMLEAHKGDVIDVRTETVSKNWVTAYEFPAVKAGFFKKELVDLSRPWGLWVPVMWNLDVPKFKDIRVREALALMQDFRYTNRVLMYGFYNYAKSFFYNSRMASSGLPSEQELALLEPWRGKIPERVFTTVWEGNESDGFGFPRGKLKRSLDLFREAGYEIRDQVMVNMETGEPFTIDFIMISPFALRQEIPFMSNLNMIGIKTTARSPELSNWLYRMRNGKWEGGQNSFVPGYVPGIMLRNRLSTQSADSEGGQNWNRVRDPAVDAMINHIMAARTPEDFYAATHALDRILLWNFYYIPALGAPGYRLVYWDRFGQPEIKMRLQRPIWRDAWWFDPARARRVEAGMTELTGKQ